MFYPLSGFMADVYCGRFKTVSVSMYSILSFFLILCLSCSLISYGNLPTNWIYFFTTVSVFCIFCIILGSAGYGANFIQFGLDQLLDVPSHQQALFVHWAVWSYELMSAVFIGILPMYSCGPSNLLIYFISVVICCCILSFLLLLACCKHHWFYSDRGQINPFRVVTKVLNFARKHKYPLQRSAFTYCDDERPTRLDFGKQRFGGPFTTEQVEDVKTFFRIMLVLLSIGPTFVMDVPTSSVSLLFMNRHITFNGVGEVCPEWKSILFHSGLLTCITRVVFLPFYVWINFMLLNRNVPRILFRLGVGIAIYLMGIISMLAVDIIGHTHYQTNDTRCVFNLLSVNDSIEYHSFIPVPGQDTVPLFAVPELGMHWSVLLPSNILLGIGPSIVTATTYEFVSAQSPHSMKGLILGTFFAITGVFEFIGSIALAPFTSSVISDSDHPPVISCLTSYLIIISVIGFVGLVLFSVVAKRYKCRERDDRPFDQRFAIEVFSKYLNRV